MTVQELINALKKFNPDTEVLITDGEMVNCYRGDYYIGEFEDIDGKRYVDIGIGGCLEQ